jgi:UDP:flavonoid glycosyltransferase YjiC (YdhE family)
MTHLFLAVTAHGYGHLAQVAPVVHALAARLPAMRLTLQGDIDVAVARARLPGDFRHLPEAADVGLLMDGPLSTRWEESLPAYEAFEAAYSHHLERQLRLFKADPPDLVLADVPWLPLDAAGSLGIPAAALCSLNWYDILAASPVANRLSAALTRRLTSVYASVDLFIRPAPSMPMEWLPNAKEVGPIAQKAASQRGWIRERLALPDDYPLVLMQFGGVDGFDPFAEAPPVSGVRWLVTRDEGRGRTDVTRLSQLGVSVIEALAASDAVLTKAGYGSFSEAACHGIPVLSVHRGDWPEEPWLLGWLRGRVPVREIGLQDLLGGRLEEPLRELLRRGRATPVEPTGADESADLLLGLLAGR